MSVYCIIGRGQLDLYRHLVHSLYGIRGPWVRLFHIFSTFFFVFILNVFYFSCVYFNFFYFLCFLFFY